MHITVDYFDKTYGTGEHSRSFVAHVGRRNSVPEDVVCVQVRFDPAVASFGYIHSTSVARVKSASLEFTQSEALDLAHALIHAIERSKLSSGEEAIEFHRGSEEA
jgi:hypothetical protein